MSLFPTNFQDKTPLQKRLWYVHHIIPFAYLLLLIIDTFGVDSSFRDKYWLPILIVFCLLMIGAYKVRLKVDPDFHDAVYPDYTKQPDS